MSIPAYHRQLLEARRVNLALIGRQEKLFLELLQEYADEIERIVRRGFRTTGHRRLLLQLQEVIQQLTRDMAARTGGGIRLTAERVAEIHARATAALAGEVVVGAAFGGVGLQAAQTVLARPELSRAFKSVRRESVQTVDRILQRGILRGATSTQIAREMRLFIAADDPRVEGAARILRDRRRIGYDAIEALGYEPTPENLAHVRAEAGRIAGRAQLIARTEIATSAHEAAVQAAIASPVVAAVRWSLSSRHPERDVCDLLAEADFYGLGAGVYDPRQTPGKPHPRCLCYLRNILREPSEWGKPRGSLPERILDPAALIEEEGLPPSQYRQLKQAVLVGEGRLPSDDELPIGVGPIRRQAYEPNPKHGPATRPGPRGPISPMPRNGQEALDHSVFVNERRRIGIDYDSGEFVSFMRHGDRAFHGYVVAWQDLRPEEQNALVRAGMVRRIGKSRAKII